MAAKAGLAGPGYTLALRMSSSRTSLGASLPPDYEGRLELTWTNKAQRLLAHEDGSYEWVSPPDYRVAEVRLLDTAGAVGEVGTERKRASENLLIRGDALNALTSFGSIPEFADEVLGRVKLAYLDPPFNTQQAFEHYDDALEHSVWLTMIRDRLLRVRDLLRPDGTVWVHLDDSEMAYCKVLLDELFGRENFVACVVWEAAHGATTGTDIGDSHNFLLVYARDRAAFRATANSLPRDEKQLKRFSNPDGDPRGPWRQGDDGTGKGSAGNRMPIQLPSGRVVVPKEGRHWAFSKDTYETASRKGACTSARTAIAYL